MTTNPTEGSGERVSEPTLDSQISYVKTWLELCSLLGRDVDRPKLEAILCSLESLKMRPSWATAQYQKIQDFVIDNRLWRGRPDDKSHADIVIKLAQRALRGTGQRGGAKG